MIYENLDVWTRSRKMTVEVYKSLASCSNYGFRDQITRSSLSVPSNIAEGCERRSTKERIRFFDIAKGSLGEFKAQTDIGIDIGIINKEQGKRWLLESEELSKMIAALMKKWLT